MVLCPHFSPDLAPTGEVMSSIAGELVQRGHKLHIVTSLPWYRHHAVEDGWEHPVLHHEDTEWGRITRVNPFPTADKANIPARALAFAGFTGVAGLAAALSRCDPEVVLAMSPPLTLGPAAWAVAKLRRVPFVFNIQDVFPDVAVEVGAITNRPVIAAARWLERTTYLAADAVTVLSSDLQANVAEKIASRGGATTVANDPAKVRVIPNFIDTTAVTPQDRENSYRREHGLTGKTVVMYAGNLGYSQSVSLLLDAAIALAYDESIIFVINGGGSAKAELERRAQGMSNVRFVGLQPKSRLPEVLAAADLHVVPLRKGLARSSVPSKLYSILASGRPVVASVDPGTEVARTLEAASAGVSVPPDDPEAFTKALAAALANPAQLAEWGRSGRDYVTRWASPAAVANAYEQLFEELIDRARSGEPGRAK